MLDEKEIWRSAMVMLKHYGETAEAECDKRFEELTREGDNNGAAVWQLIGRAVQQLANEQPPAPDRLN